MLQSADSLFEACFKVLYIDFQLLENVRVQRFKLAVVFVKLLHVSVVELHQHFSGITLGDDFLPPGFLALPVVRGFLLRVDFESFVKPYIKRICRFPAVTPSVKFLFVSRNEKQVYLCPRPSLSIQKIECSERFGSHSALFQCV